MTHSGLQPLWATRDLAGQTTCGHCRFKALVILDSEDAGFAAPCPMCLSGKEFDLSRYGGRYWQDVRDLAVEMWEHGLTLWHVRRCQLVRSDPEYQCRQPSLGQWCAFHEDPHNRTTRPKIPTLPALSSVASEVY